MHRALTEGRDLNLFLRYANKALQGRAASFCMERSGYNEGFANDQGLAFFLPNMSWLQARHDRPSLSLARMRIRRDLTPPPFNITRDFTSLPP